MKTFLIACLLFSSSAYAEPFAMATAKDITIPLHKDPCTLSDVSNLPGRAVWAGPTGTFEGCWSINTLNIVSMYFSDKSVVAIPATIFKPAVGL